ncbi:MAG: hypothetical protein ACJAT1_001702 [Marivirga sp.]
MKLIDKISDRLGNILLPVSNETLKVVVLCIFTATTFWFFNALNDDYTTRISYPIDFVYQDSGLIVVKELPDNVKINVTGGGWNLLRKTFWFTIDPVDIQLDNPANDKYFLGASLYATIADQLNEVQLNFIETDTLWVDIDSLKTHKAKIAFDSSKVLLTKTFRINSPITFSTDSVKFTGPSRFINNIPDVIFLSSQKEEVEKDFSEELTFSTYGSSLVNRNPVEVEVRFKVAKFINQELMLPYKFKNTPQDSANYIFKDSLFTLNFDIQEKSASQYSLDSFKIFIDYALINKKDSLTRPILESVPTQINKENIITSPILYKYLDL